MADELIERLAKALDCHPAYVVETVEQYRGWLCQKEDELSKLKLQIEDWRKALEYIAAGDWSGKDQYKDPGPEETAQAALALKRNGLKIGHAPCGGALCTICNDDGAGR